MSRVLNFIVEGPTEKEFVTNCIYPYFLTRGISNLRVITVETSPGFKGGDLRYARYKPNIEKLLFGEEDLLVTSLIDFYKLRSDFPKFSEAQSISDPQRRVDFIQKACYDDIMDERYIPYIQLHEFEGLLFSDRKGFELFNDIPRSNKMELLQIIEDHPNPELINEGAATAPSKRIQRLIPSYQKPFHGNMIALENGFDKILEKCPRFSNWIENLIVRMKS